MDRYLNLHDENDNTDQYPEVLAIPHSMPAIVLHTTQQQTAFVAYCSLFYACAKGLDTFALFLQRVILHSYVMGAGCPQGYDIALKQRTRVSISWKTYYTSLVSLYGAPLECRSTPYVSLRFTGTDGKMWFPLPKKCTATEHHDFLRYLNEMLKLSCYLGQTQAMNHPVFAGDTAMSMAVSEILSDILNRYLTLLTVHSNLWYNILLPATIHSRLEKAGSGGGAIIPVAIMDLWYDTLHHRRIIRGIYTGQRSKLVSQCMMRNPPCWRLDSSNNPLRANITLIKGNRMPYKEVVACVLGHEPCSAWLNASGKDSRSKKNSARHFTA